jgi:hypothetical protein
VLADLMTIAQAAPQQVECTNCSDASGGDIGMLLAALAIGISLWSLYLTALRRPAIYVEHVPRNDELRFAAFAEGLPRQAELSLWLVIGNSGASATFVDKLDLVQQRVKFHGASRVPFTRWHGPVSLHVRGTGVGTLPAVFGQGDGESYRLSAAFGRAPGVTDPAEYAAIVRDLTAVTFTLVWSFRRPRLFWPRARTTVKKHMSVKVRSDDLRDSAVGYWSAHAEFEHLADIATGKQSSETAA